jgi:Putative peptidoglycan binding domain
MRKLASGSALDVEEPGMINADFCGKPRLSSDSGTTEVDVMRLHFVLASVMAVTFGISVPNGSAHGGGGGGHGGGSNFHGGGFHGRGRYFYHGRYFGRGFGYYGYGYGYPWWGWDYGYYPYSYYGYDAYYGGPNDSGPNDSDHGSQLNSPRAVQAALAWRGFYSGRIDGVMGPETQSAIRSFQAHQGLPATGQIDNRLIDALQQR